MYLKESKIKKFSESSWFKILRFLYLFILFLFGTGAIEGLTKLRFSWPHLTIGNFFGVVFVMIVVPIITFISIPKKYMIIKVLTSALTPLVVFVNYIGLIMFHRNVPEYIYIVGANIFFVWLFIGIGLAEVFKKDDDKS